MPTTEDRRSGDFSDFLAGFKNADLGAILRMDPSESILNVGGKLALDRFTRYVYVETEAHRELRARLVERVTSRESGQYLTVLTGYSGLGKSTFLRTLTEPDGVRFRGVDGVSFTRVDFNRVRVEDRPRQELHALRTMRLEFRDALIGVGVGNEDARAIALDLVSRTRKASPVDNMLRQRIVSAKGQLQEPVLDVILRIREAMDQEPDSRFEGHLSLLLLSIVKRLEPTHLTPDVLPVVLRAANTRDFLVLLLLAATSMSASGARQAIVLDNLDRIEREYFSETFVSYLGTLYESYRYLAQKVSLPNGGSVVGADVHLILCVREATYAQIVPQLRAALPEIDRSELAFEPVPGHAVRVLLRRLRIAAKVLDPNGDEWAAAHSMRRMILFYRYRRAVTLASTTSRIEQRAMFFDRAIVPLANFSLKKLFPLAVQVAGQKWHDLEAAEALRTPAVREKVAIGMNGLWVASASQFLHAELVEGMYQKRIPNADQTGHCVPERMVLTYLVNVSQGFAGRQGTGDGVSLLKLLNAFAGILTPNAVIECVESLFRRSEEDQVHLLTVRGAEIGDGGEFVKVREMKADTWSELGVLQRRGLRRARLRLTEAQLKVLKEIRVSPNPAARAFLEHVIVHFEHLSCVAGSGGALFARELSKKQRIYVDGALQDQLQVTSDVSTVMEVISKFVARMDVFLDLVMSRPPVGLTRDAFRESAHVLLGGGRGGDSAGTPFLHGERLVRSVVEYLDHFRVYCLITITDAGLRTKVNSRLLAAVQECLRCIRIDWHPVLLQWASALERDIRERTLGDRLQSSTMLGESTTQRD